MIKLATHCFVLLTLLLLTSVLQAQTDYAITMKGDTMWGAIQKNLVGKLRRLKTADGKIKMDPATIAMYSDNYTRYYSRRLPHSSKPTFIALIIEGAIRMYTHTIDDGNSSTNYASTTWYAEKENIPLTEIKVANFLGKTEANKAFFRSLIADNPKLVKRFDDNRSFTFSFLEGLIIEYNESVKQKH